MRGTRQLLPRRPSAREALAWLLVAAFLAAPWQVSVAASAGHLPEPAQVAEGHDAHQTMAMTEAHDAGISLPASDNARAHHGDAADHAVSCCKGICSFCPGLSGAEQAVVPPLHGVRIRISTSRLDRLGLTPELLTQPPKFV